MKHSASCISRLIPFMAFVLIVASIQMPVQAHSPGPMTLSYDIETSTLLVTVTHSVSGDHRVAQIQVWNNDVSVNTRNYDSPQETTTGMDDTFMVVANAGDVLKVTATCSVSGSVTGEITVGVDSTDTTTETTTDTTTTPETLPPAYLYLGVGIVVCVILVIVVVLKKTR